VFVYSNEWCGIEKLAGCPTDSTTRAEATWIASRIWRGSAPPSSSDVISWM
jgi:hypothetical protein